MKRINTTDTQKLLDEGWTYVDVRTPQEFAAGRPPGAINIPLGPTFLSEMEAKYKPDHKLIIGCAVGGRSFQAAAALEQSGYTHICDYGGGFADWASKKLPTEGERPRSSPTAEPSGEGAASPTRKTEK